MEHYFGRLKALSIAKWLIFAYFVLLLIYGLTFSPIPTVEWHDYCLCTASLIHDQNGTISSSDIVKAKCLCRRILSYNSRHIMSFSSR